LLQIDWTVIGIKRTKEVRYSAVVVACFCSVIPVKAKCQNATNNAVNQADDAFGTNVGLENTGIYTEFDTRGFSPSRAGNVRIDGIYVDPVVSPSARLRERTIIRVSFAAEEFPFNAPTGIVDHKFRSFPSEAGLSLTAYQGSYNAWVRELDIRLPIIQDHVAVTGGAAVTNQTPSDGSGSRGYSYTIRPILRFRDIEVSPFVSIGGFKNVRSRPLLISTTANLPSLPPVARYFGQDWAEGESETGNFGATVKASVGKSFSMRGGVFYSTISRLRNFSELYILRPDGLVSHRLVADPQQDVHSTSGEFQAAWRSSYGPWQHRIVAGFRQRVRSTETGGSRFLTSDNLINYGTSDSIAQQPLDFGPVNTGRADQSSIMLGYTIKRDGLGTFNVGVQKARYRGTARDGGTGLTTVSQSSPWLYNASLKLDILTSLSVYLSTGRGLEDSGIAPENAANRNEQLPPTLSKQYEAGVRWKFKNGQWIVNLFEITKPYFSFDGNGIFTEVGRLQHRGIETSISGRFGGRLNIVAGGLLMQPRVLGGGRPAGTPSMNLRADANYRTDILGGLTPTMSLAYTGRRLVNQDLDISGFATLDLGVRRQLRIGTVQASIRAVVQNIFDAKSWKVVAANVIFPEERRRLTVSVSADF
jgi:iron complex outermembrane recepter protein